MANGNGFQFKMSIKDIVWTIILVISLIVAYTKFDTTVASHVDNKDIHLQRQDIETIQELKIEVKNLKRAVDHNTEKIEDLIDTINKKDGE